MTFESAEEVAEHAPRFIDSYNERRLHSALAFLSSIGRAEVVYDPWHYVPAPTGKPGALRNGAHFMGWKLPRVFGRMRRRLAGRDDGDRQFVRVLAAV